MTRKDKLIERLLTVPKDLTFDELVKICKQFGFEIGTKGKTSGIRVEFYHSELKVKYYAQKPHLKTLSNPM